MTRRRSRPLAEGAPQGNLFERILRYVVFLPRAGRIGLVIMTTLVAVALVFPAVDYVYLTQLFDFETRNLPALVTAAIGIVVYVIGWYALLRDEPEVNVRSRVTLGYILCAAVALIALIALLLYGLFSALAQ
ncbi:hypothetical protein QPK87_33710 [Kamptonema cortianum]|nr:hypothetical protein [Kamptonema cortianum]